MSLDEHTRVLYNIATMLNTQTHITTADIHTITRSINAASRSVYGYVHTVASYDGVKVYKNGELVLSESETQPKPPRYVPRRYVKKDKRVIDLTVA